MTITSLLLLYSALAIVPASNSSVVWEMSERALTNVTNAEMVASGNGHGHGYSDFTEVNAVVYVDESNKNKKLEYYFHDGKLYKTYTIYMNQMNPESYFDQKTLELEEIFGKTKKQYIDELFSMPIQHRVWENGNETLDLRFGAGYVYEVRTFNKLVKEKQIEIELKHAI